MRKILVGWAGLGVLILAACGDDGDPGPRSWGDVDASISAEIVDVTAETRAPLGVDKIPLCCDIFEGQREDWDLTLSELCAFTTIPDPLPEVPEWVDNDPGLVAVVDCEIWLVTVVCANGLPERIYPCD